MTNLKKATRVAPLTAAFVGVLVLGLLARNGNPSNSGFSAPVAADTGKKQGLVFRLSEGREEQVAGPPTAPVQTTKLTDAEIQAVYNRLPPIKTEDKDEKDFAFRERSLPAPRTGKTISGTFPPPVSLTAPEVKATGPLEVLRWLPEGKVELAPHLSVTFSHPMVPITALDDLAAMDVPVKLSPQPPGKWRWAGTKTLLFEPTPRFPQATEYTVTVASGTKSAVGTMLPVGKSWKFATPPPTLKFSHPGGGAQPRNPLMFAAFDQKIDPDAVLRSVHLNGGGKEWPLRLATASEIAESDIVKSLSTQAGEGRWIAFKVSSAEAQPLPGATTFTVNVGPGTPSAEGPLKTTAPQSFSFTTYGPLKVIEARCGWNEAQCSPLDDWWINFSNPLDQALFKQSQVRVTPEIPGFRAEVQGATIYIHGVKKGRTTYTVTLDPNITDVYGQTLGQTSPIVFKVGSAPKAFSATDKTFIVLDPVGPPQFPVYTINHQSVNVKLYAVGPEHWNTFNKYLADDRYPFGRRTPMPVPPGRQVLSRTIPIKSVPDELVETPIDLGPALQNGVGQVVVQVEPTNQTKENWQYPVVVWVQATKIGLDAFIDNTDVVAWTTSLADGRPLDGVTVTVQPQNLSAATGPDGLARIALKPANNKGQGMLVARKGADTAIFPESFYWWSADAYGNWYRKEPSDSMRWYVFDDRGMYRPGEEVRVKGWMRRVGAGKEGDLGAIEGAAERVSYVLRDSRGNEITKGTAPVNPFGGFDFGFKLTDTMNLGHANIYMQAEGGSGNLANTSFSHAFQVQEFRRPEFEVSASTSDGPFFIGDHATTTVTASYYAGGGLANADTTWLVRAVQTNYTPPNWNEFTFGTWTPWWYYGFRPPGGEQNVQNFTAKTDAAGKHLLRIDFDSVHPARPSSVTAEATVTDVNRQAWTSATTMLVHPSELYVGMRARRMFVQKGEPLVFESVVTDIDGTAKPGRTVKFRLVLLDWTYKNGQWIQEESNPQELTVKSGDKPVESKLTPTLGGMYRLSASVMDNKERPNESELNLWVSGGKVKPERDVTLEKVELIPNQKEYRDGDMAEILVQAPFVPAEGVMTLRRSGIVQTQRFRMTESSYTLRIPIKDAYTPNIYVQVDLVGAAARLSDAGEPNPKLPKRPAFATGALNLSVPPYSRKLEVKTVPREKAIEPGGETTVDVEVRDASGQAVAGSELAVVVVDESVLALTGYKLADILSSYYQERGADTSDFRLRGNVLLSNPESLAQQLQPQSMNGYGALGGVAKNGRAAGRPGGVAGGEMESRMRKSDGPAPPPAPSAAPKEAPMDAMTAEEKQPDTPIKLRTDFNALAVFAPSVVTDSDGRAQVKVKVPDNLTRYRVMAVAVAGGKQFGQGESSVTARMPLMVRPSAPRFLNFGDVFELPVVVQNQTDAPMQVDVAVRTKNAELTDGAGRRVTVPANDRVEIRFPAAAKRPGTARFQVGAASGKWADASEFELPVWTPATTEAFAVYGEIDAGAIVQPVQMPGNVVKQFGGVEVTTSSTELQALTDAVLYLTKYPFECSEQISSRVMSIAALRDVLTAFEAKDLPKPDELNKAVARDIKRLEALQNSDGGWGFWRREEQSWPYLSIHVAHALERAQAKDYAVPKDTLDRAKNYLRTIEQRYPSWYGPEIRRVLTSYALYVRHRLGDKDPARARKLLAETTVENMPLEALGWLLPVLSKDPASQTEVAAIRRHFTNRVTETAGAAHFATSYGDGAYVLLHSDRRADGVILEALIGDQPKNDLIPKIVRGLLAHRTAGRWGNTQENAFILLALDKYFSTYENVTPNFIARAWLGENFAGEHEFKGRTTDRHNIQIPMRFLADGAPTQNLILSKEGAGRLYYRIGMNYAPADLKLKPYDAGFSVQRMYEAVDDPKDVIRDKDGTWTIKAGARVRVRLTMTAVARRYHVALVDPVPAGLEIMNPELAVTGSIPQDPQQNTGPNAWRWWWSRTWFEHQNFRDERAEAFTSLLWEGAHTFTYVTRATTPGVFVVPPTKAEEMYSPETFGRSASDRVVVK